jgi:hypothetical protein
VIQHTRMEGSSRVCCSLQFKAWQAHCQKNGLVHSTSNSTQPDQRCRHITLQPLTMPRTIAFPSLTTTPVPQLQYAWPVHTARLNQYLEASAGSRSIELSIARRCSFIHIPALGQEQLDSAAVWSTLITSEDYIYTHTSTKRLAADEGRRWGLVPHKNDLR